MQQRIGIVLNNVPSYSETFFLNKINGLIERGARVTIFAEKRGRVFPAHWKIAAPFKLPANILLRNVYVFAGILKVAVGRPGKSYKFYKLEKAAGRSSKAALENLYINGHILRYNLDWLHYGFATVAVRRENVATAVGAKMAISFRGYDVGIYPLKYPGCYKLAWKKVDKIHTISDDLLTKAYTLGLPQNIPVVKITPAINADRFVVESNQPLGDQVNILTIARLNWKKGIQYALHAIKELKDKGLNIRYTVVGDGEDMEKLKFAAYQLGIADNVILRGKVKSEEIPSYFKTHSIYLQPSLQEGFCNAVLEAQAGGLLCIVSDAEGLQENVLHNKTGWVVKRRNVKELVNAITHVLKMQDTAKDEIRNAARTRVLRDFTLEKQLSAFEAFYD